MSEILAVVLSYGIASAIACYIGLNLRLEEIPRARIFEKFTFYLFGSMGIPILFGVASSIVSNTAGLNYLNSVANNLFAVSLFVSFIIAISIAYYTVVQVFGYGEEKEESEVDK